MKPKTKPCPQCGSDQPRAYNKRTGLCEKERQCRVRRCHRRQLLDARRGVREQCMATKGRNTILFCELCVRHEGLHLNGAQEWADDEHRLLALVCMGDP